MLALKTQFVSTNVRASSANARKDSKRKMANVSQNATRISAKEIHMHAEKTQNARTYARGIDANAWMDTCQMKTLLEVANR